MSKWKPKICDKYWYIDFNFMTTEHTEFCNDSFDTKTISNQGCFRTKSEALKALKEIKKVLKGV